MKRFGRRAFSLLAGAGLLLAVTPWLQGCGGSSSSVMTPVPAPVILTPACSNPAPIENAYDPRAIQFFVVDVEGTTSAQVLQQTPLLAAKYGFTPTFVYETLLRGFAAPLTPEQVAKLRCEPTVAYLSYDSPGTVGNRQQGLVPLTFARPRLFSAIRASSSAVFGPVEHPLCSGQRAINASASLLQGVPLHVLASPR